MPYNSSTILAPDEISGSATLPLARVKKILQFDEETNPMSHQAAFAITIATEMFIRHLSEQTMNVVKSEKKPRRNIQYKDMANAVARIDNLQFLEDVIPRTTTYREYKINKAAKAKKTLQGPESLQNGQTTLDGSRSAPQNISGAADTGNVLDSTKDDTTSQVPQTGPSRASGANEFIFEHFEPNGTARRDQSGDVNMT